MRLAVVTLCLSRRSSAHDDCPSYHAVVLLVVNLDFSIALPLHHRLPTSRSEQVLLGNFADFTARVLADPFF